MPNRPYDYRANAILERSRKVIYEDAQLGCFGSPPLAAGEEMFTRTSNYQRTDEPDANGVHDPLEAHQWKLTVVDSSYAKDRRITYRAIQDKPNSTCKDDTLLKSTYPYSFSQEGANRRESRFSVNCAGNLDQLQANDAVLAMEGACLGITEIDDEEFDRPDWDAWDQCSSTGTFSSGRQLTLTYDAYGNAISVDGCEGIDCTSASQEKSYSIDYNTFLGATIDTQVSGLTYLSSDVSVNASGYVTTSRDPNLLESSFNYDGLGRLTQITPPGAVEFPTRIHYPDPITGSALRETHILNSSGTETAHDSTLNDQVYSAQLYDGLGRLSEAHRAMPDGTISVQLTRYDMQSRTVFVSEWIGKNQFDTLMASPGTWTYTNDIDGDSILDTDYSITYPVNPTTSEPWGTVTFYGIDDGTGNPLTVDSDGLGRPIKVQSVDQAVTTTAYCGPHQEVTTQYQGASVTETAITRYFKDAFGRLVAVDTPVGGADAVYQYDLNGNLTKVNLIEDITTAPGLPDDPFDAWLNDTIADEQVRKFRYDALGRQLASYHPESGHSTLDGNDVDGNDLYAGATSPIFDGFDAWGDPLTSADALGMARGYHFETTYDAAGRPLESWQVPDDPAVATTGEDRLALSSPSVDGTFESMSGWTYGFVDGQGLFASGGSGWIQGDYSVTASCISSAPSGGGNSVAQIGTMCRYRHIAADKKILRAQIDGVTRDDILSFSFLRSLRENGLGALDRFSVEVALTTDGDDVSLNRTLFALDDDQASFLRWRQTPAISIADAYTLTEWPEGAPPKDIYLYLVFEKGTGVDPGLAQGLFVDDLFVGRRPKQLLSRNTYDTDYCAAGPEHIGIPCNSGSEANAYLGKLTRVESFDDGRLHSRRSLVFKELNGRPSAELIEIDWTGTSSFEPFYVTLTYDAQGNLTQRNGPDHLSGPMHKYGYTYKRSTPNGIQEVTSTPFDLIDQFTYNPAGGVSAIQFGNGATQTTTTDLRYRPKSINVDVPGEGTPVSLWNSGNYAYDPSGNIKTIGTQSFEYDAHGRLTAANVERQAAAITGTYTLGYTYDTFGNMTDRTWSNGLTPHSPPIGIEFAARQYQVTGEMNLNRMQSTAPDMFRYDANGNMTDYAGNDPSGQAGSAWNSQNRMKSFARQDAGPSRVTAERYLYDASGYRTVKLPETGDGKPTISLRDGSGGLLAQYVAEPAETFPVVKRHYVRGGGQLLAERTMEVPVVQFVVNSSIYVNGQYGFDVIDSASSSPYLVDIRDDSGNVRQTSAVTPDANGTIWIAESQFTLDETNYVRVKLDDGNVGHYSPPATIAIDSTVTGSSANQIDVFTTSRSGNDIILRWKEANPSGSSTYIYYDRGDGAGLQQLTTLPLLPGIKSHTIVSQAIAVNCGDFFGRQSLGGDDSVHVPNPPTDVWDIAPNNDCDAPPQPPTTTPPDFVTMFHHRDHLGSLRIVTDAAGAQISAHDYYPFGMEIEADPNTDNMNRFTGHERDANTGLDYMRARYFGGSLVRFLSVDPVEGKPDNPPSWNAFTYVQNNPIRYTDPTGEDLKEFANDFLDVLIIAACAYAGCQPHPLSVGPSDSPVGRRIEQALEGETAQKMGLAMMATGRGRGRNLGRATGRGSAKSSARFQKLIRKLGVDEQVDQLKSGKGKVMAGNGAQGGAPIRDIDRIVKSHGGQAGDWQKVTSSTRVDGKGWKFETHAYRNAETGKLVEVKTKVVKLVMPKPEARVHQKSK